MGNLIKKAGLALASFGLASAALAGSYTEGCDCEITIPKFAGGIRVGVEALYFNTDIRNTDYAVSIQGQNDHTAFKGHNVDSERDWGFGIELAYVVAGTGNDFVLNWTQGSSSSSDTAQGGNFTRGETNLFSPAIALAAGFSTDGDDTIFEDFALIRGKSSLDFTKVDLEAGQAIKIGHNSVCLRFHAGVRYAEIDSKFKIFALDDRAPKSSTLVSESEFDGIGPRFGIDGYWHLGNGFSVVAEAAAALLIGTVDQNSDFTFDADAQPPLEAALHYSESYDQTVVPNLEGRLGVNYAHHFSNSAEMNVQVGYQVSHYFDVDYKTTNFINGNNGSDVAISGLYFKVDYTF